MATEKSRLLSLPFFTFTFNPRISVYTLYFRKLDSMAYTFVASMGLSLFKFLQWASKDASLLQHSAFWQFKVIQGGWFWYQSKALAVLHCDYGPILYRFWDTATYWLKIAYFSYPSLIRHSHSLCSLWNFALKLTTRKLHCVSKKFTPMTFVIIMWNENQFK